VSGRTAGGEEDGMAGRTVYHLNIDSGQLEGATVALLPGDPGRV